MTDDRKRESVPWQLLICQHGFTLRQQLANSDSGAYASAHSAIDQGVRAARELLGVTAGPAISDFPGPPRSKLDFFER